MNQIMSIAQSITGNSNASGDSPPAEEAAQPTPAGPSAGDPLALLWDLDPRLLQMGMRLLSEYNAEDDLSLIHI